MTCPYLPHPLPNEAVLPEILAEGFLLEDPKGRVWFLSLEALRNHCITTLEAVDNLSVAQAEKEIERSNGAWESHWLENHILPGGASPLHFIGKLLSEGSAPLTPEELNYPGLKGWVRLLKVSRHQLGGPEQVPLKTNQSLYFAGTFQPKSLDAPTISVRL